MKIELHEITLGEVAKDYIDNDEEGVIGYSGRLDIRPKYQREFVYDNAKRDAVIKTITQGFPLNVMYWVRNEDGSFEVLDGQQRTVSFCRYVNGDFSINQMAFHNLTNTERQKILNYKLMIYICEGNDKEKLDWFQTINIAGLKLSDQELRNVVYTGPWLSSAKSKFSKNNCAAYLLAHKYVKCQTLRQELLQIALNWINNGKIEEYMSIHQHDPNANALWSYFSAVIEWIKNTFPVYRDCMKHVNWGELYNRYKDNVYDTDDLEQRIKVLMANDEITNHSGVYKYILTGEEKWLNLRAFSENQKEIAYNKQNGYCANCHQHFELKEMEGDHEKAWSLGGKTEQDNCRMLCRKCNREKSNK